MDQAWGHALAILAVSYESLAGVYFSAVWICVWEEGRRIINW
jgi:hypothetical protein